jgi:hypothetical protein
MAQRLEYSIAKFYIYGERLESCYWDCIHMEQAGLLFTFVSYLQAEMMYIYGERFQIVSCEIAIFL